MEKSYAEHYALLEGEHWWFRARRKILRALLAQLEWPQQPRILEIGVGPGHNLLEVYPSDAALRALNPMWHWPDWQRTMPSAGPTSINRPPSPRHSGWIL